MGKILEGTCKSCGHHVRLFAGGGMMDCEPATALKVGRDDPELAAALEQGARFAIHRRVGVCHNCQEIVTPSWVTYTTPDGATCRAGGGCPRCQGDFLEVDPKEAVPCPVCQKPMTLKEVGLWD